MRIVALNQPRPRVVVTGLGLVTGLGHDVESTWIAIRQARSGLIHIDREGGIGSPARIALDGSDRDGPSPSIRTLENDPEPCVTILDRVAREALAMARLDPAVLAGSDRTAILIGQSKGRVRSLTRAVATIAKGGLGEPNDWRDGWPDSGSAQIRSMVRATGPIGSPVAACATGLVAVLQGANLIEWGEADRAIVGAVDASLEPLLLAAFRNMKVLARHDEPCRAVRPWDARRNGFAVGEGGAVFVLERTESAEARGVRPIAEIAGGALGSDGYHVTDQDPDPSNLAGLIVRALERSRVDRAEIDHVNVHGTATRSNDPLECRSLRLAFGSHADQLSCSANKSQIGHLLGAAGAAELAITCLAIRDQFVPPTLNLDDPDPACDLDGTPCVGRVRPIGAALKIALGFGGHLAVAVLRRPGNR